MLWVGKGVKGGNNLKQKPLHNCELLNFEKIEISSVDMYLSPKAFILLKCAFVQLKCSICFSLLM